MRKFAICITKGSQERIVSTHLTRKEAMENGEKVNEQITRAEGIVSCISADFDEDGNRTDNKSRLYHVWL